MNRIGLLRKKSASPCAKASREASRPSAAQTTTNATRRTNALILRASPGWRVCRARGCRTAAILEDWAGPFKHVRRWIAAGTCQPGHPGRRPALDAKTYSLLRRDRRRLAVALVRRR